MEFIRCEMEIKTGKTEAIAFHQAHARINSYLLENWPIEIQVRL